MEILDSTQTSLQYPASIDRRNSPGGRLSVALKDLVRLRLEAAQAIIAGYEQQYGMPFSEFQDAWQSGRISNPHSYEVEGDYWAWEAADSDIKALRTC